MESIFINNIPLTSRFSLSLCNSLYLQNVSGDSSYLFPKDGFCGDLFNSLKNRLISMMSTIPQIFKLPLLSRLSHF